MKLNAFTKAMPNAWLPKKLLLVMKLTTLLLIIALVQVSAKGFSQKINLNEQGVPLATVLHAIESQTGYVFFFDSELVKQTVSVHVTNASIDDALTACFKNLSLTYKIADKTVFIQPKQETLLDRAKAFFAQVTVQGKVTNELGDPMVGVTVKQKGTNNVTVTDAKGAFSIAVPDNKAVITFSYIGYETQELAAKDIPVGFIITLKASENNLKEVVINKGYYNEKRALSTGDVSVVSANEIDEQPVTNPLAALEDRVPGLLVTQSGGLPGSSFSVQLRGLSSIAQGSSPLFIIDGVPYAPGNSNLNQLTSALTNTTNFSQVGSITSGLSPFNSINPADIESIEILKDADATAIYGSRGADGVILITTKKGKAGKSKFTANVYSGGSRVSFEPDMMNTQQYLQMRRMSFANDGQPITATNAPDLVTLDTTYYANIDKLLIGGTAYTTDAQLSISGGSENNTFLFGGSYHDETTVFPTNLGQERGSVNLNFNHHSSDNRFVLSISSIYSSNVNNLIATDLSRYLNLAPDYDLTNSTGGLNWVLGTGNPLAFSLQKYKAVTNNLLSNLLVSYQLLPGLSLKSNVGYNTLSTNEVEIIPSASENPLGGTGVPISSSSFGYNNFQSWIIEPQAEYSRSINKGKLDVLIGGSLQETTQNNTVIDASNFASDALLQSVSSAATLTAQNNYSDYRYEAIFSRINYNIGDKYIVNFTGRRDGSSRFGPGKQFGNFGSAGAAWIFSNESFSKNNLSFLSFGKLRGSYGITGNDQIGDYKFLSSWESTLYPYLNTAGLRPIQLANPNYSWEVNKKLEGAIDLGFLKDRVQLSLDYYRNRSSNQLISYILPGITGFGDIAATNFPAVVQNTGWEISLQAKLIAQKQFNWTINLNLTAPQNKLVSFPGLATSSYANSLVIGQPLSVQRGLEYLGVNPSTGLFQFAGANGPTSNPSYSDELHVIGNTNPKLYGGLHNSFNYNQWQLELFFDYRDQNGINPLVYDYSSLSQGGSLYTNLPVSFLNAWQKLGDNSTMEKYTATSGSAANNAYIDYIGSSARIVGASFMRLKTLMLSYNISPNLLQKWHVAGCKVYLSGQNLFTITGYKGADPETFNPFALAPLKTLTAGVQFTF